MNKLLYVFVMMTMLGCGDKIDPETAKKAALYDAMQHSAQQSSDKQQKLESCMSQAGVSFRKIRDAEWDRLGCERLGDRPTQDAVNACIQVTDLSKQTRLEEEERCVKLYK